MRVCAELMAAAGAGLTILAPNAELATALLDAVEREHRLLGDEIWPTPRIHDFSAWLREAHAARQLANPALPRCLTDVEERELWRAVVEDSEIARDFLDSAAAARAARRARRAMQEYAIPWRAVRDAPAAETLALVQWNADFEQRCRNLGCCSADVLLGAAGEPAHRLCWIESLAWRPAARRWLENHGAALAPQSIPLGATPGSRSRRLHAVNAGMEIAAAADWAAANLRSTDGFRAWIHVRDLNRRRAEIIDAFDAALVPERFALREDVRAAPYAVAGGSALADYAPVRVALQFLASSVGVISFQQFSELLRSPQLHPSTQETAAAARLEVELRSRAPSEADLATWLRLAEDTARSARMAPVGAIQRWQAALQRLAGVRGAHRFSTWVPHWIAACDLGPWILRAQWSSTEFQAAERFRELLGALAAADAVIGTHSRESAQRVLRRTARDTAFQPQTGVPAIWVSGQLMDPWLNYDGLWISGCGDDRWPAPVTPIALLPIRLQRDYGVTEASADAQMRLAVDLQRGWQARAAACVFSWADADEGVAAAPSPLLPPGAPLLDAAAPAPAAQPHWQARFEAAPALEGILDEAAPPFAADEVTRGIATLRAQSRCAFRGFAETRLRTERLEIPLPGFNLRERGDLVHYSLEHIWSILRDSSALRVLDPAVRMRLVDDAAQRALAKVCRRRDPGPRWRERERQRLQNVLGKWLDLEGHRAPFKVEHIEAETQQATFAGLDFRVRIDRIDSLADGARVLIDYKTGTVARDWQGERPNNPQLPIYALLSPEAVIAVAYGRVNAAKLEFVFESGRADVFKRARPTKLEGEASFAALVAVWRGRVERLAAAFAAGHAEVAPTSKACASCDLQGLCRVPAALDAEEAVDE